MTLSVPAGTHMLSSRSANDRTAAASAPASVSAPSSTPSFTPSSTSGLAASISSSQEEVTLSSTITSSEIAITSSEITTSASAATGGGAAVTAPLWRCGPSGGAGWLGGWLGGGRASGSRRKRSTRLNETRASSKDLVARGKMLNCFTRTLHSPSTA